MKSINIGFGNSIEAECVVTIVSPDSAPIKRLIAEAREAGKLRDATNGRTTRAIIVTDSGDVVRCAIQPDTVAQRFVDRAAIAI